MPARDVAAKRYAQAVFAIARDQKAFDRWREDLAALAALFAEPSVAGFLSSTRYPRERKNAVLEQGLEGTGQSAVHLAKLLVRKGRVALAPQIAQAFNEMLDAERGVVVARITTAIPLTDDARTTLIGAFRRRTGAQEVQLQESVDREIVGGAIVQVGDHLVDGSVRTRLASLRRSIRAGAV